MCNYLLQVEAKLTDLKQRSIIEILLSSLADKPYTQQHHLSQTVSKMMLPQPQAHDDTQNEVRYKLIIDPSEDESIARLLFMFGILKRENTRTYMCSDFLGDEQLQKVIHCDILFMNCIPINTIDQYNSCYKAFSHCWSHCDHESN